MRHAAVIPLVAAGGSVGTLLEIYCESAVLTQADLEDARNGLSAVVSALIKVNLRRQGETALAAVEKLLTDEEKARLDLSGRKITNSHFPGSSTIDGRSAELGIALALLMNACACKTFVVIATGTLEVVAGEDSHDVGVGAVNDLPVKIQAVLALAKAGAWKNQRRLFFIPHRNLDQDPSLLNSPAVQALLSNKVEVVPVATLREAADKLKLSLTKPPSSFHRRWALTAVIFLLAAVAVLAWRPNARVALQFAVDPALGVATPFVVCNPGGRFPRYQKLPMLGLRPEASIYDTLGWRITSTAAARNDYRLALAFVGEHSGLAFLPLNEQGDVQTLLPFGKPRSGMNQLDGRLPESGVLVFLAKASGSFDTAVLRREFSERFLHPPYPLVLAGDFLKQHADGALVYFFDSARRPSACGEKHALPTIE